MSGGVKSPSERRNVSQSAIAREAGVARTTVSLALRGGEGLNPDTVERVMEAAARLGYRPNNLVHAIRSGRTRMIGVMLPPIDTYWSNVLHGVHDGLIARDYVPLALWAEHRNLQSDENFEKRQIERLIDWRVDGAILWPTFANLYRTHIFELKKHDLPLVTVDTTLPDSFQSDAVLTDEAMGAQAVAAHLMELGHREIIHFAGPSSESWSRDRRSCFAEAMRPYPGVKVHYVEVSLRSQRLDLLRETLSSLAGVTAVYCATDGVAEEIYTIAAELERRIPEDLTVIGYGNLDFGSRLNPSLSTVRQRPYRMGLSAANLIIDRIESDVAMTPRAERLAVELIVRGSSAPARP
ncbi:MAG: LacI family transcriptional regulator [Verrucomicrobiaceae bacterium]|nr:MAG: LacI family transcriptional regulator [Verrucomicrobiaceae bacterium]